MKQSFFDQVAFINKAEDRIFYDKLKLAMNLPDLGGHRKVVSTKIRKLSLIIDECVQLWLVFFSCPLHAFAKHNQLPVDWGILAKLHGQDPVSSFVLNKHMDAPIGNANAKFIQWMRSLLPDNLLPCLNESLTSDSLLLRVPSTDQEAESSDLHDKKAPKRTARRVVDHERIPLTPVSASKKVSPRSSKSSRSSAKRKNRSQKKGNRTVKKLKADILASTSSSHGSQQTIGIDELQDQVAIAASSGDYHTSQGKEGFDTEHGSRERKSLGDDIADQEVDSFHGRVATVFSSSGGDSIQKMIGNDALQDRVTVAAELVPASLEDDHFSQGQECFGTEHETRESESFGDDIADQVDSSHGRVATVDSSHDELENRVNIDHAKILPVSMEDHECQSSQGQDASNSLNDDPFADSLDQTITGDDGSHEVADDIAATTDENSGLVNREKKSFQDTEEWSTLKNQVESLLAVASTKTLLRVLNILKSETLNPQ